MKSLFSALVLVSYFGSPSLAFAESPSPAAPAAEAAAPTTPAAANAAPEFKGVQLEIKKHIEQIYDASKKVNSKSAPEKAKSRAFIENALDWNGISKSALGDEWKTQSEANRKKFQSLLRQVVAKTAFSRLDTFWNGATYKFSEINVTGNNAVVKTVFYSKDEEILLQYYFAKVGSKWLVNDLAYEDIRYSVTISEQVKGFLAEKSFPGLLDKLKKRLDELEGQKKA